MGNYEIAEKAFELIKMINHETPIPLHINIREGKSVIEYLKQMIMRDTEIKVNNLKVIPNQQDQLELRYLHFLDSGKLILINVGEEKWNLDNWKDTFNREFDAIYKNMKALFQKYYPNVILP